MGLHSRYAEILGTLSQPLLLAKEIEPEEIFQLSSLFDEVMKVVFRQQGNANLDLSSLQSDEAQAFISRHASLLDSSFEQVKMSDTMRRRLQRSDYIFSGMKTFHEMNEAFPSLVDENGDRKTFERFLNDVRSIDSTYNSNYLRAEYNFATASAQMAAKWEEFAEDGDEYYLQYRTAGDNKVRPEHAALNGVTLPMSDTFWETYYPPNGWNCRCTVRQVRKEKYPETPHDEAMSLGEEATGKDVRGIFHFNSGKEQQTFPDYNPYTIRRCRDCDQSSGNLNLARAFVPDSELCSACELVRKCYGDKSKTARAMERRHYVEKEMAPLQKVVVPKTLKNGNTINVRFDKKGNGHLYSDVLSRTNGLSLDDLKNMDNILRNATPDGEAFKKPGHNNPYVHFYYFKATINGTDFRLNIGKHLRKKKNGRHYTEYICYSINNI